MAATEEVVVAFLSVAILALVRLLFWRTRYHGNLRPCMQLRFHSLEVTVGVEVTLRMLAEPGQEVVRAVLGRHIPEHVAYDVTQTPDRLVVDWASHSKLVITLRQGPGAGSGAGPGAATQYAYDIHWAAHDLRSELEDGFDLVSGGHWYGLGRDFRQPWPLGRWDRAEAACVTGEPGPLGGLYGGIQERLWISSSGVAIFVDPEAPLFVSVNHMEDKLIRLKVKASAPYRVSGVAQCALRYTLYQSRDVKAALHAVTRDSIARPSGVPNEDIFRYPVWSTWAQYKVKVDQAKVLQYASDIKRHGFKASQVEIDDGWTSAYGDWEFSRDKFPDVAAMMAELRAMGHHVTLWVHPFANVWSHAFWKGWADGLWIPWGGLPGRVFGGVLGRVLGRVPALVCWWNGVGAVLDLSSGRAAAWLEGRLQGLRQQYGVDSFKLDAGDAVYVPQGGGCPGGGVSPNAYTALYSELALRTDPAGRRQELRTAHRGQHLPLFFRLQDKDSTWGDLNGLRTVIPHVLTQGLLGYPFVLADMIGGNAYGHTGLPDRELYIRWTQLTALMPAMQFSVPPWRYDPEVTAIALAMCALHEAHADRLLGLAREACRAGTPIIRPLWWLAPRDEVALTISTEFLVGEDLLVAPVLERGARSRDIYLPPGTWRDALHNNELEGGRWHRNYPADLDQLPHFTRL